MTACGGSGAKQRNENEPLLGAEAGKAPAPGMPTSATVGYKEHTSFVGNHR
jgi:hypothetical protein